MRSKQVNINNKIYVVNDMRLNDFVGLFDKFKGDLESGIGANNFSDVAGVIVALKDKLVLLFPGLTPEDIGNAYMSELEELLMAWVDVNFLLVKSIVVPFLKNYFKKLQ